MGRISLSAIKSEIKKTGASKGKILYFKEDVKIRVRFLTEFEDGLEIPFHSSYEKKITVPCQEAYGRTCHYCDDEDLRTRNMYFWSVYDYESKEVKILMAAVNQCSPVPPLAALYEQYGTITDRDYVIRQVGSGTGKSFSIIGLDKKKFRNEKVKPLSDSAIMKYIDKAYPADGSEEDEEDYEYEEEEETKDYESMKPQELYKLCRERDISCKPKKAKEYYIDLLEEADEQEGGGDWGEDEDDDDWGE